MLSSCYSTLERDKVLAEYADNFQKGWPHKRCTRMEQIWDYCTEKKFNHCYVNLSNLTPEIYKFGIDGCEQINWQNWHHLYEPNNGETEGEQKPENEKKFKNDSALKFSPN